MERNQWPHIQKIPSEEQAPGWMKELLFIEYSHQFLTKERQDIHVHNVISEAVPAAIVVDVSGSSSKTTYAIAMTGDSLFPSQTAKAIEDLLAPERKQAREEWENQRPVPVILALDPENLTFTELQELVGRSDELIQTGRLSKRNFWAYEKNYEKRLVELEDRPRISLYTTPLTISTIPGIPSTTEVPWNSGNPFPVRNLVSDTRLPPEAIHRALQELCPPTARICLSDGLRDIREILPPHKNPALSWHQEKGKSTQRNTHRSQDRDR